ncbi:MAG TPA: alpha/beta fold hydrolase [Actinomycetota bacterium]|nr:alpha/beta fold hydrolase [Actinomycetota bacterium]
MDGIRFLTEDGVSLEGELRLPDGGARASAVLCHAHPRLGGSKDHPVLWAIRNELAHRGIAVLGFNFRGTMRSGGSYGGGRAEVRDVAAAVGVVREAAGGPTLVAGWSFGANVALRAAVDDDRVAALALVALPLGERDVDVPDVPPRAVLAAFDRPVLLVAGEGDPIAPVPELRNLAARLARAEVAVVPGTDHFFWRREGELATVVGGFAERALGLA